jgi:hypothetical protein
LWSTRSPIARRRRRSAPFIARAASPLVEDGASLGE